MNMNGTVDLSNIRLRTKRLLLRAPRPEDLDDFYAYASVPGVGEMAGWNHHRDRAESQKILSMMIEEKKTFAVICKTSHKMIGTIGLEPRNEGLDSSFEGLLGREIGYVLSRDYWGQGLMPEAVNEVIRYCFSDLGFDFLACKFYDTNPQSARVAEKCGFRRYRKVVARDRNGQDHPAMLTLLLNPAKCQPGVEKQD